MTSYTETIRRINAGRSNKASWEDHLRECYAYSMPERNTIDKWHRGDEKNERSYDSTTSDSVEDFANKMESQVVPPTSNWMKLESGTEVPDGQSEAINNFLE